MDYYAVLGVERDASGAEIRQSYRRLALQHHPDKVPESERESAEVMFKSISEAYEVLGNEESRMLYDAELEFGATGESQWQDFYAEQDFSFQEFELARTPDVVFESSCTLAEAFSGRTLKLKTQRQVVCRRCEGSGGRKNAQRHRCSACSGSGMAKVSVPMGQNIYSTQTVRCGVCNGVGGLFADRDLCKMCSGKGHCEQASVVELQIPPGVKNNHRIVLENHADEEVGKQTGSLVVEVHVESTDGVFRRLGADLYASCEISLLESLSGFRKQVIQHLDGRQLAIKVPRGTVTAPNTVFKVSGEGMPTGNGSRGDLYIQVTVKFPKTLTDKDINALGAVLENVNTNAKSQRNANAKSAAPAQADLDADDVELKYTTISEEQLPEYPADANDEFTEEPQQPHHSYRQKFGCSVM